MQVLKIYYNYDINKFIHFISGGYSGGTDYETPLNKAIDIATRDEKYKFADIFMLTDGACTISPILANRIRNAKNKLDLKIYTVIFGNYGNNDIDNFSDNIFRI